MLYAGKQMRQSSGKQQFGTGENDFIQKGVNLKILQHAHYTVYVYMPTPIYSCGVVNKHVI